MVATVSVYFDWGGADGAPGTSTDVDALGPPCLRFKNADDATIDGADKPTIPGAGTIYTYLKSLYLYCNDADGHTLDNFRIYSDGANGLGTGLDIYVGLQFPTKNSGSDAGYEVANNANELVAEHVFARKTVSALSNARNNYNKGNTDSLKDIITYVRELVSFYPAHIEKEDKHFFYPILDYFSKKEQDDMLEEFWEFDRMLIHEKYQGIVEGLETRK